MSSGCACCGKKSPKTSKSTDAIAYTVNDGMLSYNCLSAEERTLLQDSSQIIFEDMEAKGLQFLIGFFKKYPQHQGSFKAFRNIPPDELQSVPEASNHGKRLMEQVAVAVRDVVDPAAMQRQLYALRARHYTRKVQVKQMRDMLDAFLEFFKQDLGKHYTPQMEMAWNKLISLIISILEESEEQQKAERQQGVHVNLERNPSTTVDFYVAPYNGDDDNGNQSDVPVDQKGSDLPPVQAIAGSNVDEIEVKVTSNGADKTRASLANGDASQNNGQAVRSSVDQPPLDQDMEMVRA